MTVKTSGRDQKAITAGFSAATGAYFSANLGGNAWWQPIAAAVLVGLGVGFATYGASNDAQTDLAMVSRQIEAALHIQNLVAKTQPVTASADAMNAPTMAIPAIPTITGQE